MQITTISVEKANSLLHALKNEKPLSKQASNNIPEVQMVIHRLSGSFFILTQFMKNEEIVHQGEMVDETLQKNPILQYAKVPLGIILNGEVVVLENGKGVKRLLPGDFIGLFETAHYLNSGSSRKIGNWSLVADNYTTILFFRDILSVQPKDNDSIKHFKTFLIDIARADTVPKPITDLPLLDWAASKVTTSLLDDCIIIAHTHILPSNFAFFRHLAHLVGYHNLFILEKPYSTIRPVFNKLIHMGVDVVPVIMTEHIPYEFALKRSITALWDRVTSATKQRSISRIIIIDDGGDLLLSIPWEKLSSVEIAGVEQTQLGIDRLISTPHQLPVVVNVASSSVKKNIESIFIGKAIVNKMKSLGLLDSSPRVGIIGVGSIGNAICQELRENNKVLNYDITHHIQKVEEKERLTSIDTLMNESDVIVGCTGSDFFKGVALDRVDGNKTLISTSSADIEFFSLLNLASFSDGPFGTITVKFHPHLELKILNGGYPINFDREREWELSEDIQITRCLLYVGLMQSLMLIDSKHSGELVKLDERSQEEIVKKWLELKGERQILTEELKEISLGRLNTSEGKEVEMSVWPQ